MEKVSVYFLNFWFIAIEFLNKESGWQVPVFVELNRYSAFMELSCNTSEAENHNAVVACACVHKSQSLEQKRLGSNL